MVEKEQNGISVVTAVSLPSDYVSIQHSEPLKKNSSQEFFQEAKQKQGCVENCACFSGRED